MDMNTLLEYAVKAGILTKEDLFSLDPHVQFKVRQVSFLIALVAAYTSGSAGCIAKHEGHPELGEKITKLYRQLGDVWPV